MTKIDCKDCCKDCHKCSECNKNAVDAWSAVEIMGYVAILVGTVGVFFQIKKSGSERNLSSFSVFYLAFATISELIFMIQGIMIKNISITATKIAGAAYFGFLLVLFLLYEMGGKKKKK